MTPASGAWLDVRASAAVAGRFVALERDLHQRLGLLAASAEPPPARCFLGEASMAHGWRAGLFERLLPVSPALPGPDELIVLPAGDLERHSLLDGAADPVDVLLAVVYPPLLEGYEATAGAVAPVSDGPLALAARRAAADLRMMVARGGKVRA